MLNDEKLTLMKRINDKCGSKITKYKPEFTQICVDVN